MIVYIVYSKSKIHGVYSEEETAREVQDFLTERGGYNNGVPKRFYYIDTLNLNQIPDSMKYR